MIASVVYLILQNGKKRFFGNPIISNKNFNKINRVRKIGIQIILCRKIDKQTNKKERLWEYSWSKRLSLSFFNRIQVL